MHSAPTANALLKHAIIEAFENYWEHDGKDPVVEAMKLRKIWKSAKDADEVLSAVNDSIGGHGLEALRVEDAYVSSYYGDIVGVYVNVGDPYDSTLVYDTEKDEFVFTDWGSWLETHEHEHRVETDDEYEDGSEV